ncbi:MAG: protein-methionine-sulfoxide reductase heme-binding subunit MsrQ [Acidobacteriota bacterium]
MNRLLANKWTKVVLFLLCLAPLASLMWLAYQQDLGGNPIEYLTHATGDWCIRFVMLTLTITPLRMLTNVPAFTRYRRMLGLYAFFYGCLHLIIYFTLSLGLDFSGLWEDIVKRPYITVGMAAWLSMLPLAITSTAGWVRRMGFKNWQKLHKAIYFTAVAAVIHYWWLVKSDIRLPLLYAVIATILLGWRIVHKLRTPAPKKRVPVSV